MTLWNSLIELFRRQDCNELALSKPNIVNTIGIFRRKGGGTGLKPEGCFGDFQKIGILNLEK
jgi:hypothetical protein